MKQMRRAGERIGRRPSVSLTPRKLPFVSFPLLFPSVFRRTLPMHGKPSIHSLKRARYMALDHTPVSSEAKQFCHLLAMGLTQGGDRKYRRGEDTQRQFEDSIGAVVADLLLGIADKDAKGWCYRPSQAASFTGEYVTYRMYRSIMGAATEAGLIDLVPGFNHGFIFPDEATGKKLWARSAESLTNRYRASNALLELSRGYGITPETVGRHFIQSVPRHPLDLRSSSRWEYGEKIKGERMPYQKTPQTERLEADLHELNRFLDGVVIEGGVHRGYRRIFSQGDKAGFAWNKGGRLYARGYPSYQQLPDEERLTMKIGGESVVEIDVKASLLTILHGLMGRTLDLSRDPYEIKHIPRAVVKMWTTMTIGFHRFHPDWPDKAVEELAKQGIDTEHYPMAEVRPLILHYIPILSDYPKQEVDVFDLMFHESEAILGSMLTLMKDHRIPSLSVHDSLIVPRSSIPTVQQVMAKNYHQVCGIEPSLKVSVTEC